MDFIVTDEEAERMMRRVREEKLQLFYAKLPAEFGVLDGDARS